MRESIIQLMRCNKFIRGALWITGLHQASQEENDAAFKVPVKESCHLLVAKKIVVFVAKRCFDITHMQNERNKS